MKLQKIGLNTGILLGILCIAAALRFNHITQPFTDYINWRQASTAMMADNFYQRNGNIFYPEISWYGPGPSYNGREFQTVTYLAAGLYHLVGQQDWVGRSISVLFGLWGIYALYQLIRRVWGEPYALISAGMMAIIPGSIFFDRSFLPDPAMVALVVTSFWLLVAYLQTNRIRILALASLFGTWGFLTKITGLIVGIPMMYSIIALWGAKRFRQSRNWIVMLTASIATLLPVIAYYLWARHLALTYPPYHFAGGGNWVWDQGFFTWLKEGYFLSDLWWIYDHWLWTKPVIILVILGLILPPPKMTQAGVVDLAQLSRDSGSNTQNSARWLFHWWAFAGIIYYGVGAKELIPNSWNLHILNPAAAALAGRAIIAILFIAYKIARTPAVLASLTAIITAIIGFGHIGLKTVYQPKASLGGTQSYELGLALRRVSRPNDLVVTVANDIGSPISIYYSQRRGWTFPPSDHDLDWSDIPEDEDLAISLFNELRTKGADWFGFVREHEDKIFSDRPRLANYIQNNFELKSQNQDWVIYQIISDSPTQKVKNE